MKRNIIGFLVTPLISPLVILIIAISHMKITIGNYFGYQVFINLQFQLFFIVAVFLVFTLSIPVFLYLRKFGYVSVRHFLMLGAIWGLVPFSMMFKKFIDSEGFLYAIEMLVLAAGTGAILFLIYWFLAVRRNGWWGNMQYNRILV